ncbi:MAG: amino acid permease [Gaiellaceae bacterium]|nr:amino acid permease [Gaiellaceae bacterium]
MPSNDGARLLIITGAAVADVEELPALVRSLITSASEILVVTPVLPGRLQWLASDTDRVRHEADERLQSVMSHVEQLAPERAVSGGAGDETPLSAFADAVRRFRPDHILVALRASDHSAWQERQLVDRVREAFHIPLTIFEIDRAGHVPSPGSNTS